MHGLSVLFHDIVGDVHNIVDGTDAVSRQTALHPLGRRRKLYIFNHPGAVTGTQLAVLHPHIQIVVDILAVACWCDHRGMECLAKGGRGLSGYANHTVAVHTVGGNFILEYAVTQAQHLDCICAFLCVCRKDIDAALRGIRIHIPAGSQFLHGTHHAAGLHAS